MLFTKGAESAILPFATGGEIEKTRLHVDEFALVRNTVYVIFLVGYALPVELVELCVYASLAAMLALKNGF